jgi:hypothetical protein
VIVGDLLAEVGHRFGFRLIVEEGLSHGVLTQAQGCEPVNINPNGYYAIVKGGAANRFMRQFDPEAFVPMPTVRSLVRSFFASAKVRPISWKRVALAGLEKEAGSRLCTSSVPVLISNRKVHCVSLTAVMRPDDPV